MRLAANAPVQSVSERVAEVGADETAEDAREAVRSADQLVGKSAVA
jgi:methanogenic corrinoid protein MtbC1